MDRFDLQCKEFDALRDLIQEWGSQPAIVDDFYPEWRHGFENKMQSFLQACEANGRFRPTSRFGMRLPGVALLREAAEKFRAYEKGHRAKADSFKAAGEFLAHNGANHKAAVNADIAARIEAHLQSRG